MKVAIIGVGRMGRRHIQAVRSLGHDVCGVCDTSREALALAETEQGVRSERQFTDVRALLAATSPDVVVIATTAPTHAEYTCCSAEAGVKAILCEKPMAVSLAECDRMRSVCRAHGTKLAINHQMRFMEQYRLPKAIAESEAFGGLTSVTIVGGNFGMSMNALHYFEMFRFITGEAPRRVSAWFSDAIVPNPRGTQFQDRGGSVRMETDSGRRFYLDCGVDQGHGMQVIYAGRYGHIYVDELTGLFQSSIRQEQHRGLPTTRYGMAAEHVSRTITPADVIGPSAAVLQALIDGENYPNGEDGRLAIAALAAAYLSHEHGHRAVDLQSDHLPIDRVFPWA